MFIIFSASTGLSKAYQFILLSTPVNFRWTLPLREEKGRVAKKSHFSKNLSKRLENLREVETFPIFVTFLKPFFSKIFAKVGTKTENLH